METWTPIKTYQDLLFDRVEEGIAKITINRPEVRNAIRPQTVVELHDAFENCRENSKIGVVILTGQGPDAFCSGDDQKYEAMPDTSVKSAFPVLIFWTCKGRSVPFPNPSSPWWRVTPSVAVMFYMLCAISPSPPITPVSGRLAPRSVLSTADWAAVIWPALLAKKAREIRYLCRQYDATQALEMGLVNKVVPLAGLERETRKWASETLQHSPMAIRCLKAALNADCDGQIGLMDLAGNATLLYDMSE